MAHQPPQEKGQVTIHRPGEKNSHQDHHRPDKVHSLLSHLGSALRRAQSAIHALAVPKLCPLPLPVRHGR